jgi:hypothetical protein
MATANLFVDQRTDGWRQARCGKVTASAIDAVLAKGKTKSSESVTRANYRAQLIAEILTHKPAENPFVSSAMQWGIDQEPFARAAYELEQDVTVDTVGFVDHSRIECFGASPDGVIGEDGLVQFKCPFTATHIAYLLKGEAPAEYQPQMLAEMSCTGRAWCDFVSFDPRLPSDLQLFVKRFYRDEARIQEIEHAVEEFLAEVKDTMVRLACLKPSGLEELLRESVALVQSKRGPQPVVSIIDGRREEVAGMD